MDTLTLIIAALLAVSEVLALLPSIKSNGIFQGAMRLLRGIKTKPE